jgi:sensor histidine kinase YesM
MNQETCRPTPDLAEVRKQIHPYAAHVRRAVSIAVGTTLVIVLMLLSLGKFRLSESGKELLVALTYCTLIATPSIALLTRVSYLYTDRFPRYIVFIQALSLVCTATIGSMGAGLVFVIVRLDTPAQYWGVFRAVLPFSIVISLMFGLSISTYETMRFRLQAAALELRTRQVEQERAYKLLAESRLSSLESRIHPHFLFNTLNSIAALIPSDPVRAEDTVGKLASLLRFSLNANQSGLVPLSLELKIVRDYLEIEKTRFGQRIRYEIAVPEDMQDVRIPPLALQSLVENAVKHVAAKRTEGVSIQVTGSREANRIHLEVIDDGPGFSLEAITPEHGLGNLMGRLELLFGAAGELAVTRKGEKTAVRLAFPG